jgi:hypothetical protein
MEIPDCEDGDFKCHTLVNDEEATMCVFDFNRSVLSWMSGEKELHSGVKLLSEDY